MPRNDAKLLNEEKVLNSLPESLQNSNLLLLEIKATTTKTTTTAETSTTTVTTTATKTIYRKTVTPTTTATPLKTAISSSDELYKKLVAEIATTTLNVQQLVHEQERRKPTAVSTSATTKVAKQTATARIPVLVPVPVPRPRPTTVGSTTTQATAASPTKNFSEEEIKLIQNDLNTQAKGTIATDPINNAVSDSEDHIVFERRSPTVTYYSSLYPIILKLEDQPVITERRPVQQATTITKSIKTSKTPNAHTSTRPTFAGEDLEQENPLAASSDSTTPKRKRNRRIYTESTIRRSSLRSGVITTTTTATEEIIDEEAPTETAAATSNTTTRGGVKSQYRKEEAAESKYSASTYGNIAESTADHLRPEIWNRIDQIAYEEPKASNKRKRGNTFATRKRATKTQTAPLPIGAAVVAELSPGTAAAIAAAEFELETALDTAPAKKTRSRNMSLYDRRYQCADDRRAAAAAVSNGYAASSATTRNSSTGSASVAHTSDVDAQDISNPYYMSTSATSSVSVAAAAAVSLNGGGVALNHAPSMGTLCNIGNTCYLNSVVYTLRFAPHFLHNLHHLIHNLNCIQQAILRQRNAAAKSSSLGRGVSGAQLENARSWSSKDLASLEQYTSSSSGSVIGGGSGSVVVAGGGTGSSSKSFHQALTEKLHDLYQSLHRNEMADSSEPHHADTLLQALQEVNSTFEGNQQQDAHEFLMCVLNSLRETNQTLIKAIGECPEVIINGYFATNPDEVLDASYLYDRDSASGGSIALGTHNAAATTTTSTSSSHSTKASFFSRKSKRKEEAKNTKASRIQSPHKDIVGGGTQLLPHATSNSLFYLNTVDLSGGASAQSTVAATTTAVVPMKCTSDDETSNVSGLLKDKRRLEEKIRELNLDFFSDDFEGVVVLTTKCLSCETVTKQKQGMLDISVPVPISGYDNADFNDKPSSYIQNTCITREYFRGDNKYSCNQCTGYTEAIRSVSYEVLPRLLVVQLNRFSGGMEKVNTYVPTTFTLPCFCAKCCELSDVNKLHVYKLYSVITHVGATLSVGHYIAYTCCLDWANEYVNCPRDRRNMSPQQQHYQQQQHNLPDTTNIQQQASSSGSGSGSSIAATAVKAAVDALPSSGTSLIKKIKFGRSKASSSGDMSKNVKQLNGITSKTITNGIGRLSMNTTCHGLNCCAMRLCSGGGAVQAQQQGAIQQGVSVAAALSTSSTLAASATGANSAAGISSNSASSSDFSEESLQNGTNSNLSYSNNNNNSGGGGGSNCSFPAGYGSTGRGGSKISYANTSASNDSIWYMCDDDKIKAMTQREFEELLSPTRKITITPYLLFYARFDLQPSAIQATPPATCSGKQQALIMTPPQTSWSNESLQVGGGPGSSSVTATSTAAAAATAALHKM